MDTRCILLALAVCGYVSISSADEGDGGSGHAAPRILGGTNAPADAWPWQVLIKYRNRLVCGGVLLNGRTVATSAYCGINRNKNKHFTVQVGAYNRKKSEAVSRGEKQMVVKSIIMHPNNSDIAIMKFQGRVKYSSFIQQIPDIALADTDLINSTCFVTGWGAHKAKRSKSKVLKQLEVQVVTNEQCQALLDPSLNITITDDMICTSSAPNGPCTGDKGGPLQCLVDGGWLLAGTVSPRKGDCKTAPSTYTRASYVRDWIKANM